jgi:heat shock protein HslJ
VRIGVGLAIALFCICFEATPQEQETTETGKLVRVIDDVQATLAFAEGGKVSGNGSCNRFFGSAEFAGSNSDL